LTIDLAKLAAFALVSGLTSLVPGPSMLFVLNQSVWRGARAGAAALAGMELGYLIWWLMAALGLGSLATAFPWAFRLLELGGVLYLAWIGVQTLRHDPAADAEGSPVKRTPTMHPLRDGVVVALSNPKALVYMVALLPPFVDARQPIGMQLVILAVIAFVIDIALGILYILAGSRLAAAMSRPAMRRRLDQTVGAVFLLIALGILVELVRHW
jgi:threonine/homoserine/homoserine lactone efflux protein